MSTELEGCPEVRELIAAYALDAVDPQEAELVTSHLADCPRCAQEYDQHRESVGLLASAGGPAPDHLWERISRAIGSDAAEAGTPGPPRLLAGRPLRPPVWKRPLVWAATAVAVAAAVLIGVQTAQIDHLNHRVDRLSAPAGPQGLAAALVNPAARHLVVTSTTSTAEPLAQLVILPSGGAYLVGSRLAALPASRTYQLWSIVDGRAVSAGVLGPDPTTVAFNVDPAAPAQEFLVTVEPAGGVVTPTAAPIAHAQA